MMLLLNIEQKTSLPAGRQGTRNDEVLKIEYRLTISDFRRISNMRTCVHANITNQMDHEPSTFNHEPSFPVYNNPYCNDTRVIVLTHQIFDLKTVVAFF